MHNQWHAGETAIQRSVGSDRSLASLAPKIFLPYLTEQLREFFLRLPFLVVSYVDDELRPWGTLLPGVPGFAWSPNPGTLRIDRAPPAGDPLRNALRPDASIGLLGIELPTRRRNRVNGSVLESDASGFTVAVHQAYGNCPKYIQQRSYPEAGVLPASIESTAFSALDDSGARRLLSEADTIFVSTYAPGSDDRPAMDVSHRGGRPGFIRVNPDGELTIPDYFGNRFFNTLGNIFVTGRAGIVVPSFPTGDLLILTGDARVQLDERSAEEASQVLGAERLWRLAPRSGRWLRGVFSPVLQVESFSPQTLATGTWPQAQLRQRC